MEKNGADEFEHLWAITSEKARMSERFDKNAVENMRRMFYAGAYAFLASAQAGMKSLGENEAQKFTMEMIAHIAKELTEICHEHHQT